ncbi:MAG: hypothetical protein J2O49_03670, partial [Sciscionella sp.]|nr:hypothetical protein [Sciscionella sp.]
MRDSRWRRAGGFGALLTGIALLVGMKLLSGAPAAGNPLAIPPSAQHGQPAAPVTPSGSASRPAPAGNRTVSGS